MAFRNIRFPTGIKYGAIAGPAFSTGIARVASGRTQRNSRYSSPLRRFRVERALRSSDLRIALLAFFYNVNGAADTFRIRDFSDYEATAAQGVFRSLDNGTFQLVKRYSVEALTQGSPTVIYTKDIDVVLPVQGTLSVTGLTENTHYTLDYTTPSGVLTAVGSPTPSFSTWSGEYDVLARFDQDELQFTAEDAGLFLAESITVTEERL